MEEYNLCDELENIYKDGVFKKNLIEYRVNGFVNSLDLDFNNVKTEHVGMVDLERLSFLNNKKSKRYVLPKCDIVEMTDAENDFLFKVYNSNTKKTGWIRIDGIENNVAFDLNIFNVRKLYNTDTREVPFTCNMEVHFDNLMYRLGIKQDGSKTIYDIDKYYQNPEVSDHYTFIVNRNDCESIFKVIEAFKRDPEYVHSKYKEVLLNKKIVFSNADLCQLEADNNYILDEKGKLLQKIL